MELQNSARKATLLSSLGAGLEYYDFIIYGMMAEYLSPLFFSGDEPWLALIKAFGVFAVGYIIRPFGGILFGMLGDTFGRKNTFLAVMLLMAISTLGIGLLPTYEQIGAAAPCLLIVLRLLQGLSFGAELPGAVTIVYEYAEKKKQSSYTSLVISSVGIGSCLATLILYILSKNINSQDILGWGWRIPFLFGGLLAFSNFFIRKYLMETPEFSRLLIERPHQSIKEPLKSLIKNYRTQVLLGIGMTWFVSSLVIFSLYLPTYLVKYFGYVSSDVYFAMTWAMVWSVFSLPLCGWIADRYNRQYILIASCLVFVFSAGSIFTIPYHAGVYALITFMFIYQTFISFLTVSYFPLVSDIFPTAVRFTGIAACYNMTYSIMGCAPLFITAMIAQTGTPEFGIWFLMANALISSASALILFRRSKLAAA